MAHGFNDDKTKLDLDELYITRTLTFSGARTGKAGYNMNANMQVPYAGYTPIGIVGIKLINMSTNNILSGVAINTYYMNQNTAVISMFNKNADTGVQYKIELTVLYKKTT